MKPTPASAPQGAAPPAAPGRHVAADGEVHFWNGLSLWIGRSHGRTDWHAHHALQITFVLDGEFRFRTERDGAWRAFNGAIVPSERPHQFEIEGFPMAHVFVEPETFEGRVLARRFGTEGIVAIQEPQRRRMAAQVLATLRQPVSQSELERVVRVALALLMDQEGPGTREVDPRVAHALEHIRAHLQQSLTLEDVARAVNLSPDRMRHLFVAETGTTYRAFVLWARLNSAIAGAMAGRSWTDAAHDAGFADSAHLTRTFKRMFGIVPITLAPRRGTHADG